MKPLLFHFFSLQFYHNLAKIAIHNNKPAAAMQMPVTVQTVPCTPLHGIGANKVMASGHLPLAEGDFKWASVTVL
ncbi:hypothetical protein HMPREF0240_00436 [Clostridium sp. D5]|nr:hypothetical protein HMPREF0240_00436 [Clostridium sp. D5]